MEFSHYTNALTLPLEYREQTQVSTRRMKPHGLWISVDGEYDWPSWCKSEGFHLGKIRYKVDIPDLSKIYICQSAEDLDELTRRYIDHSMIYPGETHYMNSSTFIKWHEISQHYAGIIIAPYIWERRMELMWYYTWDCASGCIWDPSVIKSIEKVE